MGTLPSSRLYPEPPLQRTGIGGATAGLHLALPIPCRNYVALSIESSSNPDSLFTAIPVLPLPWRRSRCNVGASR